MSKRCELTGVSPLKGHNVSHSNNKTKRRFIPNLKKVTFKSDILKRNIRLNVTSTALRTVDFKGGLDKFLKSAKNINLSNIGFITISCVKVAPDLRSAKIFYSVINPRLPLEKINIELNKKRKAFKKYLGPKLNIRYTPDLKFYLDESLNYGEKISKLINSI